MITNEVINAIYKKYSKRPASIDELDFATLFEKAGENHDIIVDPESEELVIGSISEKSPFHRIPLRNVHGFVPFENWVAIAMHSSIIFLNANDSTVSVHLREDTLASWWSKLFHTDD